MFECFLFFFSFLVAALAIPFVNYWIVQSISATQKCIYVRSAFGTGSGYYAFISYFPLWFYYLVCAREFIDLNKEAVLSWSFYVDGR